MSISSFLLTEMVGDLAPGQIADVFVPGVKAAPADQLPQLQALSSSLMQSLPPIVGQLLPRGFMVSASVTNGFSPRSVGRQN